MIVNRKMAVEAAGVLGLAIADDAPITKEDVTTEYRRASLTAHPDGGGSAEAFARVDRAKHVLLRWLEREASPATSSLTADLCDVCDGSGFIKQQAGFSTGLRRQCTKCSGTGDLSYERDRSSD